MSNLAIHAREPSAIVEVVRVDMVHSGGIPTRAGRFQNRALGEFTLPVAPSGQFGNLHGPHPQTVAAIAILRVTNDPVALDEHPAGRPRHVHVAS